MVFSIIGCFLMKVMFVNSDLRFIGVLIGVMCFICICVSSMCVSKKSLVVVVYIIGVLVMYRKLFSVGFRMMLVCLVELDRVIVCGNVCRGISVGNNVCSVGVLNVCIVLMMIMYRKMGCMLVCLLVVKMVSVSVIRVLMVW